MIFRLELKLIMALVVGLVIVGYSSQNGRTAVTYAQETPGTGSLKIPELFKNLAQERTQSSDTRFQITTESKTYFVAKDVDGLGYLWASDGTDAGTERLVEGSWFVPLLTEDDILFLSVGDTVIFRDGRGHLLATEGTAATTRTLQSGFIQLIASNGEYVLYLFEGSIWATDGATTTEILAESEIDLPDMAWKRLAVTGDYVYVNLTGSNGTSLVWRLDGTFAGSQLVHTSSDCALCGNGVLVFSSGNAVYFQGYFSDKLWFDDGTQDQLTLLLPMGSYINSERAVITEDAVLYFVYGGAVWQSDGTLPGTGPITNGDYADIKFSYDGEDVFFVTRQSNQYGLWKITPGAFEVIFLDDLEDFSDIQAMNKGVFVWGPGLAYSDGTPGSIVEMSVPNIDTIGDVALMGNLLRFTILNSSYSDARILWRSDGTPGGTFALPISTTAEEGYALYEDLFGGLLFIDDEAMWFTDGTVRGSSELSLGQGVVYESHFRQVFDGHLYFTVISTIGDYDNWTREGWRTDGTAGGTELFVDTNTAPLVMSSNPHDFVEVGAHACFKANEVMDIVDLWCSDGGEPVKLATDKINEMVAVGDELFYFALNSVWSVDLWKSDLMAGTVQLVKPMLDWDPAGGSGTGLTVHQNQVYFTTFGGQLWRSDGTEAGTKIVKDFEDWRSLFSFQTAGDYVYFWMYASAGPDELWRTDGTEEGTIFLKAIDEYAEMIAVGQDLMFLQHASGGDKLWRSDGTPNGTVEVADLPDFQAPRLTTLENVLYFGDAAGNVEELWRSDGTQGGTYAVRSVASVDEIGVLAGQIFIWDRVGNLWFSDGTADGTRMVLDGDYSRLANSRYRVVGDYLLYVQKGRDYSGDYEYGSDFCYVSQSGQVGCHTGGDHNPWGSMDVGVVLDSVVLYAASNDIHGTELWKMAFTTHGRVDVTLTELEAIEGGAPVSYEVVLTDAPTNDVQVLLETDEAKLNPSPMVLTFTADNWDTPQTVAVAALVDDLPDNPAMVPVRHATQSDDPEYDRLLGPEVLVTVDIEPGPYPLVSPSWLELVEGGEQGTYELVLPTAPTSDVVIVPQAPEAFLSLSPEALTFTLGDWNIPQTVTVTPLADTLSQDSVTLTVVHTTQSADIRYDGLMGSGVTVNLYKATVPDHFLPLIVAAGDSVTLDWSAMPIAEAYSIYCATNPFELGGTPVAVVENTAVWEHPGILTMPGGHLYQVDADYATIVRRSPAFGALTFQIAGGG